MIRALIFDLDDTLYPERAFVSSGYRAVADHLSAAAARPGAEIHRWMLSVLRLEGKLRVMPAVLERFPVSGVQLQDLVEIYRRHTPRIKLYPGYSRLLHQFRAGYRLGLLTDGIPAVQKAKCSALGLENAFDCILCSWEYGPEKGKPHPYPFRVMMSRLQVRPAEALFVGDSFEKDCLGARGVGMRCVRIHARRGKERLPAGEEADFVIESLFQLSRVLKQLEGRNEAA